MRKFVSFLGDPYLHILGIGALLLGFAVSTGGGSSVSAVADADHCDFCDSSHPDSYQCIRVLSAGDAPQLGAVR